MAKKKRVTQREKALNAKVKKELQERGVIPPDKPHLNRKKFAEEVKAEWDAAEGPLYAYIMRALSCMTVPNMRKGYTLEQIGVLKVMKIALETKKFEESLPEGVHKYNLGEYFDKVVHPIIKL